jgi:predicted extracellular nuclease
MTLGNSTFKRARKGLAAAAWLALVTVAGSSLGFAQIQLSTSTPYTQDFNAIGTSATATMPANFKVDRTATSTSSDVRKVLTFSAAGTATTQVGGANLSTSASNGIYNFGDGTTSTDDSNSRSVGFVASGTATASGNLYAWLANNTGDGLSGLQVSYNVKKFRNGTNAAGFRIQLFYSTDGTNWTTAGSDFSTPFTADPNPPGNTGFNPAPGATVAVTNKVLNVSIPNSGNFYLAWNYSVTSGTTVTNAQALSIDDISILGLTPTNPTNPTGSGSATPNPVNSGGAITLSATVTPGSNPPSTGLAVSCDLSSIGGSANFALASQTATTFFSQYTLPGGTAPSLYSLPCTITDAQSRTGSFSIAFTVITPFNCGTPATAIHTIQGSGATSPLAGQTVDVEGIVVGSFQGTSKLRGFYLQEPDATWDSDPATSEGVFIFESTQGPTVSIGDRVRVRGTVSEFTSSGSFLGNTQTSSLTEIGMTSDLVCSTGNSLTITALTLPISDLANWERYEGMAVQFAQQLKVTGNFSFGTQGWVDLAPSVLYTPTSTSNQSAWPVQTSLNQRSVIALDDDSTLTNANLFPTLFPQGGLSASNTLRAGDLVNYDPGSQTNAPLVGVLDDRFGEYRLQPTAPVTFYSANPRPAIAPILASVGGRFRAVSANVLNFFTTLGSRGAADQTEFDHQKTKVIEALYAMNGDLYGLSEVQNFANGNTNGGTYTNAALQSLVDGLNCKASGMSPLCTVPSLTPFALIDTVFLGASNGTDAIRSAIIYRTAALTPVGSPAETYLGDTNRPTLAQTFKPASGAKADTQTFTFVVNHLRSKGSACGGGLDDQFQGNCNGLRLNMAQNVVTWLAGNPTADPAGANRRILMVGDYNAYYGEDPIQWFGSHGYPDLINSVIGPTAYSYNFGSQAGYLDHAMANSGSGGMNSLVKSVAEWHNNADEPSSLQALGSSTKSAAAQVAYYSADPWAASDHDPFVIGFNTLLGDLNDDAVVDAQDQRLLSASVGKSASQVDRRMDYDGDGVITLNDYRIWASYYSAFQR